MNGLGYAFCLLGFSFSLYIVYLLLIELNIYLDEKRGIDNIFVSHIIPAFCVLLMFCGGFIAGFIVHLISGPFIRRIEKSAKDEERKSMEAIRDIDVRIAVSEERERLVKDHKEQCNECRYKKFYYDRS